MLGRPELRGRVGEGRKVIKWSLMAPGRVQGGSRGEGQQSEAGGVTNVVFFKVKFSDQILEHINNGEINPSILCTTRTRRRGRRRELGRRSGSIISVKLELRTRFSSSSR